MIVSLFNHARSSSFVRHTAILTSGTVISQLIALLAMPLLSRLYTPVQFGILGLFLAVVSICSTIITLRYEIIILIPKSQKRGQALALLAMGLSIVIAAVLVFILFFSPNWVIKKLGVSDLGIWCELSVIASIGSACGTIIINWFNRNKKYLSMAAMKIVQNVSATFLAIVLGFWGVTSGLLYAQFTASAVLFTFALIVVTRDFSVRKLLRLVWPVAYRYRTAPTFLLPTAVLDTVTLQLPVILIASFFTTEASGQFSMAWRMLALPISLVGAAVAQVFYQRFSQAWPDAAQSRRLLLETWKFLFAMGLVPALIVVLFGKQIFSLVLGNVWAEAGIIASILAPMLFISFIHSTTSAALIVIGKERLGLLFGLAVLIYRPLSMWVGFYYGNLLLGLGLFTIFEIVQMCIYQYIVLKDVRSKLNT